MDKTVFYPIGTKVRLDNEREGAIAAVFSMNHEYYYALQLTRSSGDYLRNENGRFRECYVSSLIVHVSNINEHRVI